MAENDERSSPSDPPAGGDELGDRVARARDSISRSLRDVVADAERDEAALRTQVAEDVARIAAAELGRSLSQLTSASDQLVSKRLAEAVDRLGAEAETRQRTQLAEVRRTTQSMIEKSSPKLSRSERRHELKLVRAESSQRVSRALTKLEQRGGSLIGELDARLGRADDALAQRAQAADERIAGAEQRLREAAAELERAEGEAGGHLAAALRRVEEAAGRVGESRARIAVIEGRALESASRASASAALAQHATELESKLRDAVAREDQAAERIVAAERRLLDLMGR